MQYTSHWKSPLGDILLAAEGDALTGLWFEGQRYYARSLSPDSAVGETKPIELAKAWLEEYFSRSEPKIKVPLRLCGTQFQNEVWELLCQIPYAETVSYGELAAMLAKKRGIERMSARAVASAIAKNSISVIVPCHRVIAADGSLAGYAGGIERKRSLLVLENPLYE